MATAGVKFGTTWKTSLSDDPQVPRCSLVSLWDLLFWWDANANGGEGDWRARYNNAPRTDSYDHVGYELDHNIIYFDDNMYVNTLSGMRRVFEGALFDEFSKRGIDLSLSAFDKRSTPTYLTEDNVASIIKDPRYSSDAIKTYFKTLLGVINPPTTYGNEDLFVGKKLGVKVYERSAALAPTTMFDFYTKRANYILDPNIKPNLNPSDLNANGWIGYGGSALTDSAYRVFTDVDFMDSEHKAIHGWITDQNKACDIMLCSEDEQFETHFTFVDKLGGQRAFNGLCLNYMSPNVWWHAYRAFDSMSKKQDVFPFGDEEFKGIRAFFDFKVLDENDSEPYGYFNGDNGNACNPVAEYLLKHVFVWVKASFYADYVDYRDFDQKLNRFSDVRHRNVMLGSGSWKRYDDAFTRDSTSTLPLLSKEPGLPYVPKTTPALDAYTKTLFDPIQGDPLVAQIVDAMKTEASRLTSRLGAVPVRPLEESNSIDDIATPKASPPPPPVWFDPASRGSSDSYLDVPIGFGKEGNLVMHGRILSPTIDEIWMAIKSLAMGRNADDATPETDIGYPVGDESDSLKNKKTPTDTRFVSKKHRIKNYFVGDPVTIVADFESELGSYDITSWVNDPSYIKYEFLSDLQSINESLTTDKVGSYPFSDEAGEGRTAPNTLETHYKPDPTVWSNRELEAAIKGIRFNLVNWAKFSQLNSVWTGPLGKTNLAEDLTNVAGGTAYMLHKDYDALRGNTVYDSRRDSSQLAGDTTGVQLLSAEEIPDFRSLNGRTNLPAFSAYLAADGTWRSTWQCVNVPVIDETTEPF